MSLKNVSENLRKLAQSYFFTSDDNSSKTLVILVHGFEASATETRPLGEYLKNQGYDVHGILLKGHGTTPRDLDTIKWGDWIEDIQKSYDEHATSYDHTFIGGTSLGGALSLYASTKMKFNGLFTINALYHFPFIYRVLTNFLKFFKFHRPRNKSRVKWYSEQELFAYHEDCTHAANEAFVFLKILHRNMGLVNIPVLVIQSLSDKTISPKSGEWISKDLQTEKELMLIDEGDHILTVDPNRGIAFERIKDFIKKRTNES
jgi:carboxylesterase